MTIRKLPEQKGAKRMTDWVFSYWIKEGDGEWERKEHHLDHRPSDDEMCELMEIEQPGIGLGGISLMELLNEYPKQNLG